MPVDGRQHDPLQRWRGAPLICFGASGSMVTMFTKNVPSFDGGSGRAQLVSTPSDPKVRNLRQILPLHEMFTTFPGPLRARSKKKEVLQWMEKKTTAIRAHRDQEGPNSDLLERVRGDERLLLWQLVSILVNHDGVFEGKMDALRAVNEVLVPHNSKVTARLRSTSSSDGLFVPPQPEGLAKIQQALQTGAREDAVWHAVDSKEWPHALIISSTIDQGIYKRVVQEFVRSNVRSLGQDARPLAALYQSFAGNAEESVDELVPAAARAGFQMMSTEVSNQPQSNGFEGLESWRDTLSLILANRTAGDQQTLLNLGKLLQNYGRVEAAHCCFLFSRPLASFGDAVDPDSAFKLLGSPIGVVNSCSIQDLDAIMLSEIYEFAISLPQGSPVNFAVPHMQSWKLLHARMLMENGKQTAAQQYCEAIMNAVRASTKLSPYYHQNLLKSVDQLTDQLSQSANGDSSSWISKPTMEKVSGSMWTKFNSFVAGDDNDATAKGSKPTSDTFARVPGESPDLSRSPSSVDMYAAQYNHKPAPITTPYSPYIAASGSRPQSRGPHNRYAPSPKHDNQDPAFADAALLSRSYDSSDSLALPAPSFPQGYSRSAGSPTGSVGKYSASGYHPASHLSQVHSANQDAARSDLPYQTTYPPSESASQSSMMNGSMPELTNGMNGLAISTSSPSNPPYTLMNGQSDNLETPTSARINGFSPQSAEGAEDQPQSYAFVPPSPGPGYQPLAFDDNEVQSPPIRRPRQQFMDDDDDFDYAKQAPNLKEADKKAEKARIEKEGAERMRKAAEEDSKKDASAPKKGWLGSLFAGSSKDTNEPTVIKAKLGEESSFVYDPDLKRWINKKAGAEQTPVTLAAPPPKSRGPSGSLPASRAVSPMPIPGGAGRAALPPPPAFEPSSLQNHHSQLPTLARQGSPAFFGATPSLADLVNRDGPLRPPSRPATSASNASSIDDLIGPPVPRRAGAGTVKKGKKGRGYIDVMAK